MTISGQAISPTDRVEAIDGIGTLAAVQCLLRGVKVGLSVPAIRRPLVTGVFASAVVFGLFIALPVWALILWVQDLRAAPPETGWGWVDSMTGWLLGSSLPIVETFLVTTAAVLAPVVFQIVSGIVLPVFKARIWNAARSWAGGAVVEGKPSGLVIELKIIGVEIRRLLKFVLLSLAAMLLNIIPVVGSVAYFLAQAVLAARTMGWDLLSYHFELHDVRYHDQKRLLASRPWFVLAIGGAAVLLTIIPVVQVFFLCTNAAGAGLISAQMGDHQHG